MPNISNQNAVLSIKKLMIFKISGHKYIGSGFSGIGQEEATASSAQCYTRYFSAKKFCVPNNRYIKSFL